MQAAIFDLDQTLLDRDRSLLRFLKWQCRGMLGPYIDDQAAFIARFIELDSNGTVWKDKVYASLIEEFGLHEWAVSELLSVYVNCFCGFSVPCDGAIEALEEISKTFKVGLISNGMSPFQERNFRALGLSTLFQSVIVSAAVGLRKPDAEIFWLCCRQLDVAPSDSYYIGDNPIADIEGAKAAGLKTVFIPSSKFPECPSADIVCTNLSDLPGLIG